MRPYFRSTIKTSWLDLLSWRDDRQLSSVFACSLGLRSELRSSFQNKGFAPLASTLKINSSYDSVHFDPFLFLPFFYFLSCKLEWCSNDQWLWHGEPMILPFGTDTRRRRLAIDPPLNYHTEHHTCNTNQHLNRLSCASACVGCE